MTEFEKWWDSSYCNPVSLEDTKVFAEQIWHAAQRALIRTINKPPHVPEPGDKVRFLSLCHPSALGEVKEVVSIEEGTLENIYWMGTKTIRNGEEFFSSGILGEVEPVKEVKDEN